MRTRRVGSLRKLAGQMLIALVMRVSTLVVDYPGQNKFTLVVQSCEHWQKAELGGPSGHPDIKSALRTQNKAFG